MDILAVVIADLIYLKEGTPDRIVNIDLQDRLKKLADRASVDRLLAMADFLGFIEISLKNNVNRQYLTDVLALTANETTAKWIGKIKF